MTGLCQSPRPYDFGESARDFSVTTSVLQDADGRPVSEVAAVVDLDMATQDALRAGLTGPPDGHVIADLGATTFMDSSGLACLLHAHAVVGDRGDRLVVACPEGQVRRLLEMTDVLETLSVVGDVPSAQRVLED